MDSVWLLIKNIYKEVKQSNSIFIFLFLLSRPCIAQQIVYGNNNFIEYQIGTLPVVISVPHGGSLVPSDIPNRTCNNPTTVTDAFTIEMAAEIRKSLYAKTGCYPHIIICHLKRTKLDCNRNISDGACNNSIAEVAWNEFQDFIDLAQNKATQQFSEKVFYVDLHGHGNPIQRIELGYLLYDNELALSDSVLNTDKYINDSSIGCLARNNVGKFSHAQLLRGPKALGTILTNADYPSVPSEQIPSPGTNTNYFRGGYNTANHTCFAQDNVTRGVQVELNFTGVRDTPSNRALFADKFCTSIIEFLKTHSDVVVSSCKPLASSEYNSSPYIASPNPVSPGYPVSIKGIDGEAKYFTIINSLGQLCDEGIVSNQQEIEVERSLKSGLYIMVIYNQNKKILNTLKLIIE